jgi:acetoin utilization deacetylase AcuC-like enzyme
MKRRDFLLSLITLPVFNQTVCAGIDSDTGIVLDDGYLRHQISPQHPESPARYQAVRQAIESTPWAASLKRLSPKTLSDTQAWLSKIHSEEHIEAIAHHKRIFNDAVLATAGCLAAVDAVMQGCVRNAFCASRPPGHHATNTGQEEGFCYFNHIAVAARYVQQHYQLDKVLIIDWDYHHGNGTEWAFYRDPSVLFFSTHDQFAYPGTGSPKRRGEGLGEGLNINVHLDCGCDDKTMMAAFEQYLRPALKGFKPDFILISAGFDSRQDDLLGCFKVTDDGFYQLTRWVMAVAEEYCDGRIVSLLEGGYNIEGNSRAVISHLRALSQG